MIQDEKDRTPRKLVETFKARPVQIENFWGFLGDKPLKGRFSGALLRGSEAIRDIPDMDELTAEVSRIFF